MRLTEEEAQARLRSTRVARLATVGGDGQPHLVPVTFAVDGDLIYTAMDHKPKKSANLRRLRNIRENPKVALLADRYEDDWDLLWWARADGWASVVEDERGLQDPIDVLVEKYPQYRESRPAGPVIVIQVDRWKGWSSSQPEDPATGARAASPRARQRRKTSVKASRISGLRSSGVRAAGEADGLAHLGQVLGAMIANRQVLLNPLAVDAVEGVLYVVGHHLDGLLARQFAGREPEPQQARKEAHRGPPPSSDSSTCLSLLRPRCSSTRWLASLIASTWHTSALLSPSTSRSSTTSRCRPAARRGRRAAARTA